MTNWVIDLEPAGYGEKAKMLLNGEDLGTSRQPIYAAARILLGIGALPSDTAETRRKGVTCMTGVIGSLATRSVSEPDRTKITTIPFELNKRFPPLHSDQE
jgi:hypothetical protein